MENNKNNIEKEKCYEVVENFKSGLDCGQTVLSRFADKLGIEEEFARKIASPLGAGMFSSDKCGAVTGAYIALGLKYGHSNPGEFDKKAELVGKIKEFDSLWAEFNKSDICKDMLGYDLQVESEMKEVMNKGLLFDFCPQAVNKAIQILEKIL